MPGSSASSIIGRSNDEIAELRFQIADLFQINLQFNLQSAICNLKSAIFHESLMQIARVIGTVVSTQKHRKFEGAKLLLVQPLNLDDTPRGAAMLAIDGVGAGVHEKVLVVFEGRAAGEALGRKAAPVDAAIIGIVDSVDCDALEGQHSS